MLNSIARQNHFRGHWKALFRVDKIRIEFPFEMILFAHKRNSIIRSILLLARVQ